MTVRRAIATRLLDKILAVFSRLQDFAFSGAERDQLAHDLRVTFHGGYAVFYLHGTRDCDCACFARSARRRRHCRRGRLSQMKFGYARARRTASVDAQVKALRAAGAEKVFEETASGAKTDRAQFRRASRRSARASVLVTRLDRWPDRRATAQHAGAIAKGGAGSRSLADAWADRRRARTDLTVPGGLAEFERELIAPDSEGRSAQSARDGRPCPHAPSARGGACGARQRHRDASRSRAAFNVSRITISRLSYHAGSLV